MKILEQILDSFFQVSGLKINKDKTQIMKLGSTSQGNVDMNNVTTLGKMVPFVKVLGVYFFSGYRCTRKNEL